MTNASPSYQDISTPPATRAKAVEIQQNARWNGSSKPLHIHRTMHVHAKKDIEKAMNEMGNSYMRLTWANLCTLTQKKVQQYYSQLTAHRMRFTTHVSMDLGPNNSAVYGSACFFTWYILRYISENKLKCAKMCFQLLYDNSISSKEPELATWKKKTNFVTA